MKKTAFSISALSLLTLLSGCFDAFGLFGPARFKVTEVEITTEIPEFDDSVVRRLIDYDTSNRVSEIEERINDDRKTFELSYNGDVVSEIDYRGPGNDRVTVEFDVANGKITGGSRRGDDFDSTFEVDYFNNDRKFFQNILVRQDLSEQFEADVFHEVETRFSYEGTRLDRTTTDSVTILEGNETSGETRTTREIKYNGENKINRIDTEIEFGVGDEIETVFQSYSVDYTENGKIDDVTDEDADDDDIYNVKYDEDGKVTEIEHITGNITTIISYTYEEGSVSGGFFGADIPVPSDLTGTMQEVVGAEAVLFPLGFVGR